MQLEIITPESQIFSGEANGVQFPGLDGSFQVLDNHAPIISSLTEGIVKVDLKESYSIKEGEKSTIEVDAKNNKIIRVQIKGGVIEMLNNKIIVLAE